MIRNALSLNGCRYQCAKCSLVTFACVLRLPCLRRLPLPLLLFLFLLLQVCDQALASYADLVADHRHGSGGSGMWTVGLQLVAQPPKIVRVALK